MYVYEKFSAPDISIVCSRYNPSIGVESWAENITGTISRLSKEITQSETTVKVWRMVGSDFTRMLGCPDTWPFARKTYNRKNAWELSSSLPTTIAETLVNNENALRGCTYRLWIPAYTQCCRSTYQTVLYNNDGATITAKYKTVQEVKEWRVLTIFKMQRKLESSPIYPLLKIVQKTLQKSFREILNIL